MTARTKITQHQLESAFAQLFDHAKFRLEEKGNGAFLSSDEYIGVIEVELTELKEAVETRGKDGKVWELLDIAYACVFAIASHEVGGIKKQLPAECEYTEHG